MNSDWLAAQIVGLLFAFGGLYVIGDWRTICGLFLLWVGWGIMHSVSRSSGAVLSDPDDKNWVEE